MSKFTLIKYSLYVLLVIGILAMCGELVSLVGLMAASELEEEMHFIHQFGVSLLIASVCLLALMLLKKSLEKEVLKMEEQIEEAVNGYATSYCCDKRVIVTMNKENAAEYACECGNKLNQVGGKFI